MTKSTFMKILQRSIDKYGKLPASKDVIARDYTYLAWKADFIEYFSESKAVGIIATEVIKNEYPSTHEASTKPKASLPPVNLYQPTQKDKDKHVLHILDMQHEVLVALSKKVDSLESKFSNLLQYGGGNSNN